MFSPFSLDMMWRSSLIQKGFVGFFLEDSSPLELNFFSCKIKSHRNILQGLFCPKFEEKSIYSNLLEKYHLFPPRAVKNLGTNWKSCRILMVSPLLLWCDFFISYYSMRIRIFRQKMKQIMFEKKKVSLILPMGHPSIRSQSAHYKPPSKLVRESRLYDYITTPRCFTVTYLPGRGQRAIKKVHDLDQWLTLLMVSLLVYHLPKWGEVDVIICVRGPHFARPTI